jgi:type II secretion system protein J
MRRHPLLHRRGSAPASCSRAGFTLAEVLVTVLIMGGIMVSITQILHAARTSRDTIHNIQETQLAGPAIMDMIERDLRGIVTYNRTKQDHLRVENRVMLGVDGDSIDFVTTTDNLVQRYDRDRFLRSSINEVGYRLRPNPGNDDFLEIYRREDAGVDDAPFDGGEFTFLHDRVKDFDIRVFAEDGTDAEPFEDWGLAESEDIGVPARIEITLVLELQRRIEREALMQAPSYLTEVTYKRVIRLPEPLRVPEEQLVVPLIPSAEAAEQQQPQTGR